MPVSEYKTHALKSMNVHPQWQREYTYIKTKEQIGKLDKIFLFSVEEKRDQCMMSHVISARSATSSVHAQSRHHCMIATWSVHAQWILVYYLDFSA